MMRFIPQSLFSRMVLILLGGLILVQSISVIFHLRERDRLLFRSNSMESAQRIADTIRLLNSLAPVDRHKLVTALNSPTLQISLGVSPPSVPHHKPDSVNQEASFTMLLRDLLGDAPSIDIEVAVSEMRWPTRQLEGNALRPAINIYPQQRTVFTVWTRLQDGTMVSVDAFPSGGAFPTPPRLL